MTQKEFTDRTGLTPTYEEYQSIESMYMASGEMDKDEFCREYKKIGGSRLLSELYHTVSVLKGQLDERENQVVRLAEVLIGKAHSYNDTDFHKEAVKLIGQKDVAILTLSMGLPLWEEDIEYIKNNLN